MCCMGMHETVRCMVYSVAELMIVHVECACLAVAALYPNMQTTLG